MDDNGFKCKEIRNREDTGDERVVENTGEEGRKRECRGGEGGREMAKGTRWRERVRV